MDIKSTIRSSPSVQFNSFLDYLIGTDLEPSEHRPCITPIITCQETDSLSWVFRRLSNNGVLSCPVLSGTTYQGFISMFDIVDFVTNMNWGSTGEQWTHFLENSQEWKDALVEDVMETPMWRGRQTADPLYNENSTFHALEKLAITRAHRAVVLSNRWSTNPRVTNVMTQSMLISEIRQRMYQMGGLRNRRVADMTNWFQTVRSISEDSTAINAFKSMRDNNVSGLAVVDDEGVLTGSISVRDLRGVGVNGPFFSRLFRTVKEFKQTLKKDYPELGPRGHYYVGQIPLKGRYVTPNSTFEDCINLMSDGCVHRLFVCSPESVRSGRPVADNVLTQTDMLTQVLRFFASPAASWQVSGRG
jgi:CBS domain-containing protein